MKSRNISLPIFLSGSEFQQAKDFCERRGALLPRRVKKIYLCLKLTTISWHFNNTMTQRIFSEEDNDFVKNSYPTTNEAGLNVMAFLGFQGTKVKLSVKKRN